MSNKAVFIDRDGVINKEKNYVHRIEDFEFIDGIFEILQGFQNLGYLLIIVSNQAGIGRGYYTEEDFQQLTLWMLHQFEKKGIFITHVYYSPFHPEFGIGPYKKDSYLRKPNPGMIEEAAKEYDIDLQQSIVIGDKETDIKAGFQAGVKTNILITNDHTLCSKSKTNLIYNSLQDLQRDLLQLRGL